VRHWAGGSLTSRILYFGLHSSKTKPAPKKTSAKASAKKASPLKKAVATQEGCPEDDEESDWQEDQKEVALISPHSL
jgi:hypothetical protein